jgi:membrane protease YdiL (CAAX protease family)
MIYSPRKATCLYLGLTLAFSAVVWTLIIWSGHLSMGFGVVGPALMWCPAMAVMVTCRLLGRGFRSLAWHWPNGRYLAVAYFVPIGYTSVAYGAVWGGRAGGWNSEFVTLVVKNLELNGFPAWASFALYIFLMATGGVIQNVSMTLGEEIGWRGFLVPELMKQVSFTRAGLFSGLIWAAWHSPLLLFADYHTGTNRWYALSCSSITCVSVGFILMWLTLKSGSLWPAALLHACHNVFVPIIFDNLIRNTGTTFWYTTEFGVSLAASSAAFALYFWTRRNEVQRTTGANPSVPAVPFGYEHLGIVRSRVPAVLSPAHPSGSVAIGSLNQRGQSCPREEGAL